MSQVPVKYVSVPCLLDKQPTTPILKRPDNKFVHVVPLSTLREVVERLQKLVNEARGFEAMANDQSHGYTNRRILRERIDEAHRLLASLGEVGCE